MQSLNTDDLIYKYKGHTADANFNEFDSALSLIDKKERKISLADAKNDQIKFKSELSEIKKWNKKNRSNEYKSTLYNIEMLYKARNNVIKFYDDYSSIVSEAKHQVTKGTGL